MALALLVAPAWPQAGSIHAASASTTIEATPYRAIRFVRICTTSLKGTGRVSSRPEAVRLGALLDLEDVLGDQAVRVAVNVRGLFRRSRLNQTEHPSVVLR